MTRAAGRRVLPLVVLLGALAATAAVALAGTVSWGSAIEVPGTAALNVKGFAGLYSVSCASAGNCSAGGYYADGSGVQALVVSEQGGVWGQAIRVPGTAALNVGHDEVVISVSCAAPGECTAGGGPDDVFSTSPAFVVDEANGSWGTATAVRGLGLRNSGAAVSSVSCGSPGNCAAAGYYIAHTDKYGFPTDLRAFVVSETNGKWGTAHPVPAPEAFNGRGGSSVESVSCAGTGYCMAGGSTPDSRAFIVVARNGTWGRRQLVAGLAALTGTRGLSAVNEVSCSSPGTCVAGGSYRPGGPSGRSHLFVVTKSHGKWGKVITVKGIPAAASDLRSISCASPGNCAGGGVYTDGAGKTQPFVVAERNGVWGPAVQVPGTVSLNVGGDAWVRSVSCASAGNCAASGIYVDGSKTYQAFVVSQHNGVWGTAVNVPDLAALGGVSYPSFTSISCASAGRCAVVGSYRDGSGHGQAFVTAP